MFCKVQVQSINNFENKRRQNVGNITQLSTSSGITLLYSSEEEVEFEGMRGLFILPMIVK